MTIKYEWPGDQDPRIDYGRLYDATPEQTLQQIHLQRDLISDLEGRIKQEQWTLANLRRALGASVERRDAVARQIDDELKDLQKSRS